MKRERERSAAMTDGAERSARLAAAAVQEH